MFVNKFIVTSKFNRYIEQIEFEQKKGSDTTQPVSEEAFWILQFSQWHSGWPKKFVAQREKTHTPWLDAQYRSKYMNICKSRKESAEIWHKNVIYFWCAFGFAQPKLSTDLTIEFFVYSLCNVNKWIHIHSFIHTYTQKWEQRKNSKSAQTRTKKLPCNSGDGKCS